MVDWDQVTGACMGVFGDEVTYFAPGRAPVTVTGVFDRNYRPIVPMGGGQGQEAMAQGGVGNVTGAAPILGVQLSQFPIPPEVDAVVRLGPKWGNLRYRIEEVQEDGHGAAKLLLMRA